MRKLRDAAPLMEESLLCHSNGFQVVLGLQRSVWQMHCRPAGHGCSQPAQLLCPGIRVQQGSFCSLPILSSSPRVERAARPAQLCPSSCFPKAPRAEQSQLQEKLMTVITAHSPNLKHLNHMKMSFCFSSESVTRWFHLPFRFFHCRTQNKALLLMGPSPQRFSANTTRLWFHLTTHEELSASVGAVRQRSACECPTVSC